MPSFGVVDHADDGGVVPVSSSGSISHSKPFCEGIAGLSSDLMPCFGNSYSMTVVMMCSDWRSASVTMSALLLLYSTCSTCPWSSRSGSPAERAASLATRVARVRKSVGAADVDDSPCVEGPVVAAAVDVDVDVVGRRPGLQPVEGFAAVRAVGRQLLCGWVDWYR